MGNPLYEERTHDSGKGDVYKYDKAYRLTNALIRSNDPSGEVADTDWLDYAYEKKIDYNLDDVSNRTSVVETPYGQSAATESYTSNSVNWYTAVGGVSRTHDDNGNLTDDGSRQYYYDYRNNLVKIEESSTAVAEYDFDSLNRRTGTSTPQQSIRWLYDDEECAAALWLTAAQVSQFVFDQQPNSCRAMLAPDHSDFDEDQNISEETLFYLHSDALVSPRFVTDPAASICEAATYSPWGEPILSDASGGAIQSSSVRSHSLFAGMHWDEEARFYYVRRRSYNPSFGRFLQRDALGGSCNASPYEYVTSRPTSLTDPSGLAPDKPNSVLPDRIERTPEDGRYFYSFFSLPMSTYGPDLPKSKPDHWRFVQKVWGVVDFWAQVEEFPGGRRYVRSEWFSFDEIFGSGSHVDHHGFGVDRTSYCAIDFVMMIQVYFAPILNGRGQAVAPIEWTTLGFAYGSTDGGRPDEHYRAILGANFPYYKIDWKSAIRLRYYMYSLSDDWCIYFDRKPTPGELEFFGGTPPGSDVELPADESVRIPVR